MSFWYLTPSSFLLYYQHIGGTCCLIPRKSVLKVEEGLSSETTRLHTPLYRNVDSHNREHLKSHNEILWGLFLIEVRATELPVL